MATAGTNSRKNVRFLVHQTYQVELLLELFISKVDTKLLEAVYLKGLKPAKQKEVKTKAREPSFYGRNHYDFHKATLTLYSSPALPVTQALNSSAPLLHAGTTVSGHTADLQ